MDLLICILIAMYTVIVSRDAYVCDKSAEITDVISNLNSQLASVSTSADISTQEALAVQDHFNLDFGGGLDEIQGVDLQ